MNSQERLKVNSYRDLARRCLCAVVALCLVLLSLGAVAAPTALSIVEPPMDKDVVQGETAILSLAVAGTAAPSAFAWRRMLIAADQSELVWTDDPKDPHYYEGPYVLDAARFAVTRSHGDDGRQIAALSIQGFANATDEGWYWCEAREAALSGPPIASPRAYLKSASPLAFVRQPQSADKYLGEEAILRAIVSGGVGLRHYQWSYDADGDGPGSPVDIGRDLPIYAIPNLALADAGVYVCAVNDSAAPSASAKSEKAVVNVARPLTVSKTMALPPGRDPVVVYARSRSFSCWVVSNHGFPPYAYQWTRNGSSVEAATLSSYEIPSPEPGQSGAYSCLVMDMNRTVREAETPVTLAVAPQLAIAMQPESGTVKLAYSSSFTFRVAAEGGYGERHYQWKFDRDGPGPNPAIKIPNSPDLPVCAIEGVTMKEAGDYICEVCDSYNQVEVSAPATLVVDDKL